jgi:serine/threonine-protein kinase BUR1
MGELYHKGPILAGHSDYDQLQRIVATCGPLNDQTWPRWRELPGFPENEGKDWDKVLAETSMADVARKDYRCVPCTLQMVVRDCF